MPISGKGVGKDDLSWKVESWRSLRTGRDSTRSGPSNYLDIDYARVLITKPSTGEETYITVWGPIDGPDWIDEVIEYYFDEEDYKIE